MDTAKPAIYARAGIPEYLIVKPYGKQMRRELTLWGHRLVGGVCRPWAPGADGWLVSAGTGLGFRVAPDRQALELIDTHTGAPLLSIPDTHRAYRQAERTAREAERTSREAKQAASEAKQAASEAKQAVREAERRAAEQAARAEAAESRLKRLEALLRGRGIDPEAPG